MIKQLLSKVAPFLGSLIGGKFGEVAIKAISSVLLPHNENPSESLLEKALEKATPEQIFELERLNKETEVELAEIAFKDVDSARNMNIVKNDNTTRNITYILCFSFIIRYFLTYFLAYHHIKLSPSDEFLTDVLCDSFLMSLAFYFGSKKK